MPTKAKDLLVAARVAHEQGSFDQALSIATSAAIAADGELTGGALIEFQGELARLIQLTEEDRRSPSRALHVVIAGDSLALPRPENAKTYDPRSSPSLLPTFCNAYPALLLTQLRSMYPERDVVITNMSRASQGLAEVAADAYVSLFYLDPTAVVLHCGIVDCWPRGDDVSAPPKTDLDAFRAALERFLSLRRDFCQRKPLVLIGLAPTDARWRDRLPGIDRVIDRYDAALRAVTEPFTSFVDMRHIVDAEDPYASLHLDGIHLNLRGHELLAAAIAAQLEPEMLYGVPPTRTGGSTSSS